MVLGRSVFSAKACGEKGVFVVVILERISDDVRCASFSPTLVANAGVYYY